MNSYIVRAEKTGGQVIRLVASENGLDAQMAFRREFGITGYITIVPFSVGAANLMCPNHIIRHMGTH